MIFYVFGMVVALIISSVGIFIGIDLKNPSHWLFIFCGFLFGLFVGLTRNDWISGIGLGIVSAVLVVYTATVLQQQKQYLRKATKKLGINEASFDIFEINKKPKKMPVSSAKRRTEKPDSSAKGKVNKSKSLGKRNPK
jgi:uncharacterized membrane protein